MCIALSIGLAPRAYRPEDDGNERNQIDRDSCDPEAAHIGSEIKGKSVWSGE